MDRLKAVQLSRRSSGRYVGARRRQSSYAVFCQQPITYLLLVFEANLSDSHAPIFLEIVPGRVDYSDIVLLVACRHLLSLRSFPFQSSSDRTRRRTFYRVGFCQLCTVLQDCGRYGIPSLSIL